MWSALPSVTLDKLIVPGPVERGLYVASGSADLMQSTLKRLVDLLDVEHSTEHIPDIPTSKLGYSAHRYWRRNSRIGQLIWIDSGNQFDPYGISREAKRRGLDPMRILRTIKVGRPFTAYQFQQMLERVPNPALWAPDKGLPTLPERVRAEGLVNSQAVWWTPLVVISDLMGLFYDPDLPQDALIRAFRSFMIRLAFLRQRAIVLAFLNDHIRPPADRQHLLADVLKMARRVSEPTQQLSKFPVPRISSLIAAA